MRVTASEEMPDANESELLPPDPRSRGRPQAQVDGADQGFDNRGWVSGLWQLAPLDGAFDDLSGEAGADLVACGQTSLRQLSPAGRHVTPSINGNTLLTAPSTTITWPEM